MTFEDSENESVRTSILSTDKFRVLISDIANSYPAKKSLVIDFDDIISQDVAFSACILKEPKRCLKLPQGNSIYCQ